MKIIRRIATMTTMTVGLTLATLAVAGPASAFEVDPEPTLPGGLQEKADTLLGVVMGVAMLACVAGVLIAAISMAISYRNGDPTENFGRLMMVMVACILVGSATSIVFFLV